MCRPGLRDDWYLAYPTLQHVVDRKKAIIRKETDDSCGGGLFPLSSSWPPSPDPTTYLPPPVQPGPPRWSQPNFYPSAPVPYAQPQGTNGLSVASLVFGILGVWPLAIIFGHVALI
jgi:hypothetical protein